MLVVLYLMCCHEPTSPREVSQSSLLLYDYILHTAVKVMDFELVLCSHLCSFLTDMYVNFFIHSKS